MSDTRAFRALGPWPLLALGALTLVFVLMLVFSRKAPVIDSLDPAMAAPGEEVVVTGNYFGRTEREGTLSLAGEIPPPSLIRSWSDQKIVFVVPEDAASGIVTVSNSQGTSVGVLFTNTRTIPTVLQSAGDPGFPLIWAVVPSQPVSGQSVTLSGRGFGSGDESVVLKVSTQPGGPVWEIGPGEALAWSDRAVTFRMPLGAGPSTTVGVRTPRGETQGFPVPVLGSVTMTDPRVAEVEIRAEVSGVPSGAALTLWGPVPHRSFGTGWTLGTAAPPPLGGAWPLVFSFPPAQGSTRTAVYRLSLTSWARRWDGIPAGLVTTGQSQPAGDELPKSLWKTAAPALKTLTAKWGLEIPDPWLRIQRLQTGMAAAFRMEAGASEAPVLTAAPAQLLSSKALNSYEASTLALALAAGAGIPGRLVGGLWQDTRALWHPRTWAEVWVPGAGWVSWDPVDGSPGSLDNRHFAFLPAGAPVLRQLPRSTVFGPPLPGSLGTPSGEVTGSGPEPVVRWEITTPGK